MVSVKYKILIIKSVTTMGIKMERERKFRNFHKASYDSICDDKNDYYDLVVVINLNKNLNKLKKYA